MPLMWCTCALFCALIFALCELWLRPKRDRAKLNEVLEVVLPVSGSEPILNPNRTRTEPQLRFGVRPMLDFPEPVRTCANRFEPEGFESVFSDIFDRFSVQKLTQPHSIPGE
ncbi:hypothetical protein B0H16DRAFT_1575024 [Mycena metata]|uniref:Secreted protein n=1 Tax=Mycena metata TaxID=1033252 RepID=A0AAD7I690_9AGAR|nr:hypothetical protein B0H16DRAFT_1575024 [Mycena metata]